MRPEDARGPPTPKWFVVNAASARSRLFPDTGVEGSL
jgi:hypothetical protein